MLTCSYVGKRHSLRLWLRDEELARTIPEALEPTWKRLYQSATPETEVR
jgi:hypothetical protein